MPTSDNRSIPIETRLNIKALAALAQLYAKDSTEVLTKSGIVNRACLDTLKSYLESGSVRIPTSIEQALSILSDLGIGMGKGVPAKLARAMSDEDRMEVEDRNEKVLQRAMEQIDRE